MHRILYLLLLEPGQDYLPDDPAILDEPQYIKINGKVRPYIVFILIEEN